ncbi:beta-ketoacyl-ACP synthase, partial [Chromobacterium piscinae]
EIRAINLVFGDAAGRLHISSNKASIGHCMGAAGALEAAATVLALESSLIPPTLHTRGDEVELRSRLVGADARPAALRRALSQSFGFGGACSCIVFGHYREDGHA